MNEHKVEIRPLNGLRGIAALSVAMGHYQIGNLLPVFANFTWWQGAAVDLFFCLSGFTMCLAYRAAEADRLPLRNYLVARVARIYPLYLLTIVACNFIAHRPTIATERQHHVIIWDFIRQMTMTNAWSVISTGSHSNSPAWSVSVEFFCYLFVFPALFYVSRRMLRLGWRMRLILSTVLIAGSYYVFVNYFDWRIFSCGRDPHCGIPEIAYSVNLLRGVLGFTAGWVVYASFLSRDRLWASASRYADLITLGVLALLMAGVTGFLPVQLMVFGFPLLILGVSSGRSLTSRFLSWGPVHYLGNISYSVYLLHEPWLDFGTFRAGLFGFHPTDSLSSSVVLVGGMIAVSVLSYHAVELPLRRIIRAAWQAPDRTTTGRARGGARAAGWAVLAMAVVLAGFNALQVGVFRHVPPLRAGPGEELLRYPTFERVAGDGWGFREDWGVWSIGRESTIVVPMPKPAPAHLRLFIKGSFYLNDRHPALTARIIANGVEIGAFRPTLADSRVETTLQLPADVLSSPGAPLRITLVVDSPASPKSLGLSADSRMLGFALTSLKLLAD